MQIQKMIGSFMSILKRGFSDPNRNRENMPGSSAYDFPVKPGTNAWKRLKDREERIAFCQIPENVLYTMTTENLIETVLNYPFLMEIYCYDTYHQGFHAVLRNFNGLAELLCRDDAAHMLLEKYKQTEVAKDAKTAANNIFTLANIEIILAQNEILEKFHYLKRAELETEARKKYAAKTKHPYLYGMTTATFMSAVSKREDYGVNETVKTPKGTDVEVMRLGEKLSPIEKKQKDDWVKSTYPNTTLISSATTNYNCHSYAWYSQSTSNLYWMNYPNAYMTDGSYTKRTIDCNAGDRVYYSSGGGHSGIVTGTGTSSQKLILITSKWGKLGLVSHKHNDCPYYVSDTFIEYYY